MKIAITIIAAATIIAGGQLVQSDPGRTNPSTNMTQPTGEDRGLWGACCLEDGSCVMELATLCFNSWGGTFLGGECADNPCPDPIGACCNSNGGDPGEACALFTEAECESYNGYWQGGATDCVTAGCEWDIPGACCLPYGGCESMTMMECDQEYMADGGMAGDNWQAYTTCEEADCAPTCDPTGFFDNVAYPLTISCQDGPTDWPNVDSMITCSGYGVSIKVDLNGDNAPETIVQRSCWTDSSTDNKGRVIVAGESTGTVEMLNLLDLDPTTLTYTDHFPNPGPITYMIIDFLDVTGDGLPDAIIGIGCYQGAGGDGNGGMCESVYYVTNISTPPGVACATDVNNDDVTDTADILAILAGWGPCVQ
jgi:hypothetical protein